MPNRRQHGMPFFAGMSSSCGMHQPAKAVKKKTSKKENIIVVHSATASADPLPAQTFFKPEVPKEDKSVDKKAILIDQKLNVACSMTLSEFVLERPVGRHGVVEILDIVQHPTHDSGLTFALTI